MTNADKEVVISVDNLVKLLKSPRMMAAISAAVICFIIYLRAFFCDFVNIDDYHYVVNNPAIRALGPEYIRVAFQSFYMGVWMPLTWLSFAVDYHFWGLDPRGYHLTNILLHAANTALVVLIADKIFQRLGISKKEEVFLYPATLLLAGLVWGIHPLRVESVAWVSERKDVLNGIFSLSSIYYYLRYVFAVESLRENGRTLWTYSICIIFFVLSLMVKPVSVVIPAMLLVLDWFPLNRFRNGISGQVLKEKIPFLVIAAIVSIMTILGASGDSPLISYQVFPFFRRVLLAGNALFEYCSMILYPVGITHLYLLPQFFPVSYSVNTFVVALFSCFILFTCKKIPLLTATWALFILPLAPLLGFFQSSAEAFVPHYTYLPSVAPSIAAAGIINLICDKYPRPSLRQLRLLIIGFTASLLVFYGIITYRLIGTWQNSETLWTRQILIQPVGRAYQMRGVYYLGKGRYLEAADDLLKAIAIANEVGYPGVYNAHAMRGAALNGAGRYEEAVQEFTEAIRLNPQPNYFYHRGLAFSALRMMKEAQDDFNVAGNDTGALGWR